MPAGALVTIPPPVPDFCTESARLNCMNCAPTVISATKVSVHAPDPLHPPLHETNSDPPPASAERLTTVPSLKANEHIDPQSTPAGLLDMVPTPVPDLLMVNVTTPLRAVAQSVSEDADSPTVLYAVK